MSRQEPQKSLIFQEWSCGFGVFTGAQFLTQTQTPWGFSVNKQDLINEVAKVADLPKNKAQEAVEAIFESIKLTLKTGGEVRLVGFGTFTVSARAATTGRNPRTGEAIAIPASKQPKFKAGKQLKDAVND